MLIKEIITILNEIAPPHYACAWDKTNGLQIGSPAQKIKKILLALDVTTQVVETAIKQNVDLIIAHHPLIFDPLPKLDTSTPQGQLIAKLLNKDIALFIAHTNLDAAPQGVNYQLAIQEGLAPEKCEVLEPTYTEKLFKYVVFVPTDSVEKVHQAIASAGGGQIGNYAECTFRTLGTGTFRPLSGTNPYIGKTNILEKVAEYKIETIIPETKLTCLINAVKAVHPYEEVAYDISALQNPGRTYGLGLIGQPIKKIVLNKKIIRRLAVGAGSGGSLISKAFQAGAEALITGEANYHAQLLAQELGLTLILKGHAETEQIVLPPLKKILTKKLNTAAIIL